MTYKILRNPSLAEWWEVVTTPNAFLFGGENEEERSRVFSRLCDALSKKIEHITVVLESVSDEFEGIILQTIDYAGYEVCETTSEMVAA